MSVVIHWTANFCIHANKGPVIIMAHLKSIYNSPFKDLHSHPIHTCFLIIASNGKYTFLLSRNSILWWSFCSPVKILCWESNGKVCWKISTEQISFQCFISEYGQFKFPYLEIFEIRIFSENQKKNWTTPKIHIQMLHPLCHKANSCYI